MSLLTIDGVKVESSGSSSASVSKNLLTPASSLSELTFSGNLSSVIWNHNLDTEDIVIYHIIDLGDIPNPSISSALVEVMDRNNIRISSGPIIGKIIIYYISTAPSNTAFERNDIALLASGSVVLPNHFLTDYPMIRVYDQFGVKAIPDISYDAAAKTIILNFSAPFKGSVYLFGSSNQNDALMRVRAVKMNSSLETVYDGKIPGFDTVRFASGELVSYYSPSSINTLIRSQSTSFPMTLDMIVYSVIAEDNDIYNITR